MHEFNVLLAGHGRGEMYSENFSVVTAIHISHLRKSVEGEGKGVKVTGGLQVTGAFEPRRPSSEQLSVFPPPVLINEQFTMFPLNTPVKIFNLKRT